MNEKDLVLVRLDSLLAQCTAVEKAIKSDGLNPRLYKRTAEDFLARLVSQSTRVARQSSQLKDGTVTNDSWSTLRGYDEDCSQLFGECLAFLQAARSRGHDVEADLCEIADALLDELVGMLADIKWSRFTVLASEDYFSDFAQIIRLRFPFCGIWDLPVCAHELGHFVAGRLNLPRPDGSHQLPFQEFKTAFKERGEEWVYYLEEYFADIFASFVLGPAYACTCLLLRFDPASAHRESDRRHPSYAKRAYAIVQTLRRMSTEGDSKGDFKAAADLLTELWNKALRSAGESETIPEQNVVEGLVRELYQMLSSGVPGGRFNRWKLANKQTAWLDSSGPRPGVKAADFRISDLLNSAWLCRLKPDADLRRLNQNLIELCRLRTAAT
jgi:hypothetical protein